MSEEMELQYINYSAPPAERSTAVHSGRRLKVTVLRVAVVLAVTLIVAFVFRGVALFFHTKKSKKGPQTTNLTTMANATFPSSTETTSLSQTYFCDVNWALDGTTCYYFSSKKTLVSWEVAKAICQDMAGDLVKIDSREEQAFLFNKMSREDYFWIGLTDSQTEGEWKWTDGSSLNPKLTFWHKEPDNWTGPNNNFPEGEDCVIILAQRGFTEEESWGDVSCVSRIRFICEKEATYQH